MAFRKSSVAEVKDLPQTDAVGVVRMVRSENVDYSMSPAGPPLFKSWVSQAVIAEPTIPTNNIYITTPPPSSSGGVNLFGDVFRL